MRKLLKENTEVVVTHGLAAGFMLVAGLPIAFAAICLFILDLTYVMNDDKDFVFHQLVSAGVISLAISIIVGLDLGNSMDALVATTASILVVALTFSAARDEKRAGAEESFPLLFISAFLGLGLFLGWPIWWWQRRRVSTT